MTETKRSLGHALAATTILIWGTTMVATKLLLIYFEPIEILVFRFSIGFCALFLMYPKPLLKTSLRQELVFAAAGLLGVASYFLLENIALGLSTASNVSVILSVSPFFTAMVSRLFHRGEGLGRWFFIGFAASMAGICLITLNGSINIRLNPIGDLLAVLAALSWACYTVILRKTEDFGHHIIQVTRRVFLYGLLFMVPALFLMDFSPELPHLFTAGNLYMLLYLAVAASALCFVTWNKAVGILGPVRTSVYIYAIPVITNIFSVLVLRERVTLMALAGIVFTLAGLVLSQKKA